MTRCVNIDWLEVYTIEATPEPRDAEYFRTLGFSVAVRPYGTRVYQEMFTIFDNHDEPFIEVRRNPVGNTTGQSIIDPRSAHIRLCNRTCYYDHAAAIMANFCQEHGFVVLRISRLDICYDFIRFDRGDDPQRVLDRYMRGTYSKINQANLSAHGRDLWDGRFWNSLSWGAPKSMISTKFYNKSMELREAKDKPYIRQAWAAAGLVDDFITLTKHKADGTVYKPDIWRVEFSIRSSVKRWYVVEDPYSSKTKLRSIHHTLDCYQDRQALWNHFAALARHYFHFKIFEKDKRKDRCSDKVLFDFNDTTAFYSLDKIATTAAKPLQTLEALRKRLQAYRETHYHEDERAAATTLLRAIDEEILRKHASAPYDLDEVEALRLLLARNMQRQPGTPATIDLETYKAMASLERQLWSTEEAVQ